MESEFVEEYLEALYDLSKIKTPVKTTAISACLNIAPASATEMLQKLARSRYIKYKKYYGATLTPKGCEIAIQIKRRHRLAEKFLTDILGMEDNHDVACELEHLIKGEFEKRLCQLLDHPTLCPDEKEIPPCEDGFEACETCTSNNLKLLTTLREGESGRIKVVVEDHISQKQLFSQGIVPGTIITLHKRDASHSTFRINDKEIALDNTIAKKILINK